MTVKDVRDIARIWIGSIPADEKPVPMDSLHIWNSWFKKRLKAWDARSSGPTCRDWVICHMGWVVGYVGWSENRPLRIFVHPDLRGQGIGTKAMKMVMAEARMCRKLSLVVITRKFIDFYMRFGFRQIENSSFWTQTDRDAGRIALGWGILHGTR